MDQIITPSLLDTIRTVLTHEIRHPNMERFALAARLREDLAIDSVVLMELFVRLETGHGFEVPKTALDGARLITVGDLILQFGTDQAGFDVAPRSAPGIDATAGRNEASNGSGVHGEMPMDIKVHCFASCLCDGLKRLKIDHRPFYAAIPGAGFAVDERFRLRYHSAAMDHRDFREWFERLYGGTVTAIPDTPTLLDHVAGAEAGIDVIAMVDLHRLPERDNPFDRDPFPHYVLIAPGAAPETVLMRDVDFRWEGPIATQRLALAMDSPAVSGGYLIDHRGSHAPETSVLSDFFQTVFGQRDTALAAALRIILDAHLLGRDGLRVSDLTEAVAELPILIIRLYAYEHLFAYFWRELGRDTASFDFWADEIERLVQGYRVAHLEFAKLAAAEDPAGASKLGAFMGELHRLEKAIKAELSACASLLDAQPDR